MQLSEEQERNGKAELRIRAEIEQARADSHARGASPGVLKAISAAAAKVRCNDAQCLLR